MSRLFKSFIIILICLLSSSCSSKDIEETSKRPAEIPRVIQKAPVVADQELYDLAISRADSWQADSAFINLRSVREAGEFNLDGKANFWEFQFFSNSANRSILITVTNYDIVGVKFRAQESADLTAIQPGSWISSDQAFLASSQAGIEGYLTEHRKSHAGYNLNFDPSFHRDVWRVTFDDNEELTAIIAADTAKVLQKIKVSEDLKAKKEKQ